MVLSKLRRVLPDHLEVTRQAVALASGKDVWVDAVEVARVAAGERDGGELRVGWRAAVRSDMLAIMDRAVTLANHSPATIHSGGPPTGDNPPLCWLSALG